MSRGPVEMVVQGAFDLLLADSPEARAECAKLSGRCIVVELTDLRSEFSLLPGADGIRVEEGVHEGVDARIRAGSADLLRMVRAKGTGATGRLHIEGDAEVAQRFRAMLRLANVDPEERLASVIGDVPAHEIGRLWRGMSAFGEEALRAFGTMAGEYLHFESRTLPTRNEVAEFIAAVDALRDDVARAEARLRRLETRD